MLSWDMEDILKGPNWTSKDENYNVLDEKFTGWY